MYIEYIDICMTIYLHKYMYSNIDSFFDMCIYILAGYLLLRASAEMTGLYVCIYEYLYFMSTWIFVWLYTYIYVYMYSNIHSYRLFVVACLCRDDREVL
jgi:hypothetical protein